MELFDQPVPLAQAVKILQQKKLLPADLSSADIRNLAAAIRNQSMVSAHTLNDELLQKYKDVVESILHPEQKVRLPKDAAERAALRVPGVAQEVTTGLNPAKAQEIIQKFLKTAGYTPGEGKAGTIQDLSSLGRIKLVIKTNSELAWGAGQFIQQNADPDLVDLWPAAELYRIEDKKVPRDWEVRWNLAARESGDLDAARALANDGMMAALKSSPIWAALGDGAGGFEDTLGNAFPPFAFNSGMWTRDVSRKDAEELGLLDKGEAAKPAAFDFATLFGGERKAA